jgi:broad specificity phosphatase PhoE
MSDKPVALLIRHGKTEATDKVFVSRSDFPLDAEGERELHDAINFLKDYDIKLIYSSPLIRSLTGAEMLSESLDLDVYQDRGLLPWDRGIFTGVPEEEGQDALNLFVTNPDVKMPFGESRVQAEERIDEFFGTLLPRSERKLTAFFTHHSVIDILAYKLAGGKRPTTIKNIVECGGVAGVFVKGDDYELRALFKPSPGDEAIS